VLRELRVLLVFLVPQLKEAASGQMKVKEGMLKKREILKNEEK